MRHGLAASGTGTSDRERPLTSGGVSEMERAAAGLACAGILFDRIVSSPLVRAVQTARLVARAQPASIQPEMIEELAGGAVPSQLFRALAPVAIDARLLLVGHEPDISGLAQMLIGLPAERSIPFAPGTIARIDVSALPPSSPGSLVWLLTARLAGEFGGT